MIAILGTHKPADDVWGLSFGTCMPEQPGGGDASGRSTPGSLELLVPGWI